MSQPAIFQLLLADDRADQFLQATEYLRKRLADIRAERSHAGKPDAEPTFADVERTHIQFLRATYRPFVSVASEYVRVGPSGDSAALTASGGTVSFSFPTYGHFTSDIVAHVQFDAVGTTSPVVSTDPAANPSPWYRFCAYPGIRAFERVEFRSAELVVDDYTRDDVSFVDKFQIPGDRRAAWDRGMGQGEVKSAEYANTNGYSGVLNYREGLQTFKYRHPSQDLWIPLHFWMCGCPTNALLNDLIPNSQRTVSIALAPISDILRAYDQNTLEVTTLPISQLGMRIELYVNNLFTNPEIYDIFAARVGFSLIRVHRRQAQTINQAEDRILLNKLKYPAEYMYVGVRDRVNAAHFDHWHLFGRARARTNATSLVAAAAQWNATLGMNQLVCRSATESSGLDPILDTMNLTAHNVDLYPAKMAASFYNTYLPQRYFGGTALVAPRDEAAMLVTFCLYPGSGNPSGYYNLSAGRELYFNYTAATVVNSAPAEFVASMSALNFLVRNGDRTTLRFSI